MTVWNTRKAQQQGIDVNQVFESYARHLTADRQKVRDNPRSLDANQPAASYDLAVTQDRTASGYVWRTLGQLPYDIAAITVTATSTEAARNKVTVRELLEQRYRREFASALQRAGLYTADLEGRRAAMGVALASNVGVADLASVGTA